jgi:hypothetical protein
MTNSDAILLLHRAEEAEERAAAAENALRDIALFLSCGGYNDVGLVEFDPAKYTKKIKETITEQIEQLNDGWGNIVHANPESEDAFWSQYLEARH